MPVVQLAAHVKSSTLYGRTVVQPNFLGLMGYYYFVYLWGYALRAPLQVQVYSLQCITTTFLRFHNYVAFIPSIPFQMGKNTPKRVYHSSCSPGYLTGPVLINPFSLRHDFLGLETLILELEKVLEVNFTFTRGI